MNKTSIRRFLCAIICLCVVASVNSQDKVKIKYDNASVYAGIEVGSKGVKLSIVDVDKNSKNGGSFTILKDTSINTDFISFSSANSAATLNALSNLYDYTTRDLKIPVKKSFYSRQ